jgi:hypothetical protein
MALTLNATSGDFVLKNALYLANASDLAYSDDPGAVARDLLDLDAQTFRHAPSDTQGFVGRNSEFLLIAFRGSESIRTNPQDWITDMRMDQVTAAPFTGRVHAGFSRALTAAWQDMETLLRQVIGAVARVGGNPAGLPVFLTGHSLGAALATLAHCRLASGNLPAAGALAEVAVNLKATYTFGGPRVGNAAFCKAFQGSLYRVVNDLDIVPLVPLSAAQIAAFRTGLPRAAPGWLRLLANQAESAPPYEHAGTLVHLDPRGRPTIGKPAPDWLTDYLSQVILSFGRSLNAPISDHAMDSYITAIASNF